MLIKSPHLMFTSTLILGTIMACSSSSWVIAWVGLELNLMSFIPLLIKNLSQFSMELTIKYFLVQALASMVLIFTAVLGGLNPMIDMSLDPTVLISIALAMKAGVAPLHFWFPQIMVYADWIQAFLIMTWQKIAPLILLSFMYNFTIPVFIFMSAVVGMLGGLNQTMFKKILAYSSIIHSSWLISVSFLSDSTWWLYFMSYAFLNLSVVIPLTYTNINFIKDVNSLKMKFFNKILIFINILSLAGLPPFLGFFIKMISINLMLTFNFNFLVLSTLILSSLISFYFYSRLTYSSILFTEGNIKPLYINSHSEISLSSALLVSLFGNLFISFLVLLT